MGETVWPWVKRALADRQPGSTSARFDGICRWVELMSGAHSDETGLYQNRQSAPAREATGGHVHVSVDDPTSPTTSGDLQILRWTRRRSETLQFVWTPGRAADPSDDELVGVVRFEDQPKLGPAVLYDRPTELSLTTSVAQFRRNSTRWVVRLGSPKSEAVHDQSWFRRPPMDPAELEETLARLKSEPPPGTFFDEYWTRAQLEHREWYSVHGLAKDGDGLREVIVLCCCVHNPPSVAARVALAQVKNELGYDFVVSEVYRTHDVGPAVSGIGALHIERKLDEASRPRRH